MSIAFRTSFSILVFIKVLENTTLAKGIKAFIYGVCISEKTITKWAFEERVEVFLFYLSDESGLSS